MNYSYTVMVYCGEVLTCVETGTFSGTRIGGGQTGIEGNSSGQRQGTVKCCAARQKI